jgi:predicted transcriptional regulator
MITDMIDREIKVDDWVVFYSNLYRVRALGKANATGAGTVQIMIWNGGETARPVKKHSKEMAIVDRNDVLIWLLKKGHK